jgi:excisionase family DNA binding protein
MHQSDDWRLGGPHDGRSPMPLEELPAFLTVEEAATVLRIGRTSAYLLCQRWRLTGGETGLPVVRVGRQLRVPRAALERMTGSRWSA